MFAHGRLLVKHVLRALPQEKWNSRETEIAYHTGATATALTPVHTSGPVRNDPKVGMSHVKPEIDATRAPA